MICMEEWFASRFQPIPRTTEKNEKPHKTVSNLSCDMAKQSLKSNGKIIDQGIKVYYCIRLFHTYLITIPKRLFWYRR